MFAFSEKTRGYDHDHSPISKTPLSMTLLCPFRSRVMRGTLVTAIVLALTSTALPAMGAGRSYTDCVYRTYVKLKKLDPKADFGLVSATAEHLCRQQFRYR